MYALLYVMLLALVRVCQPKHDHMHVGRAESEGGEGIGCYVCASVNGSNPACHDDFNRTDPISRSFYKPSCSAPKFDKSGRPTGMRFAKRCYKLKATRESDNFEILVRDCDTIVEGADPHDTIGATSYNCPTKIIISEKLYTGCLLTCDFDGCNGANGIRSTALVFTAVLLSLAFQFKMLL